MKKFWSDNPGFANDALLTCVTLAGLAALVWAAPSLGASPQGRFPATLIGLMRSRIVTYNPGVNGYYEQLLNGDNALAPMNDKTFHILAGLVHDRSAVQGGSQLPDLSGGCWRHAVGFDRL